MKTKKPSVLARLMELAGNHKYFTYASCVLAVLSALVALSHFMKYGGSYRKCYRYVRIMRRRCI